MSVAAGTEGPGRSVHQAPVPSALRSAITFVVDTGVVRPCLVCECRPVALSARSCPALDGGVVCIACLLWHSVCAYGRLVQVIQCCARNMASIDL